MFSRIGHYIKDVYAELRKVNWPTRTETTKFTLGVIVISAILAVFFAGLDYLFSILLDRFFL